MNMTAKLLILSLLMGLVACGGSSSSVPGPIAAPKDQPKPDSPRGKANEAFEALSSKLEGLEERKEVDPAWLREKLNDVLAIDSTHSGARFNLAILAEREGNQEKALDMYKDIVDNDPSFAPAAENIAAHYVATGRVDDAREIYERVLSQNPKNITSRLGLARLYYDGKKYKKAIKLAREVLQRKADAIEAFRVLAASYRAIGDGAMAELIVGRALKLDKNDPRLHYILGQILLDKNQLADGIEKLKHIITIAPDWTMVRAELARIAMKYRDFANAAQQYEAILKDHPNMMGAKLSLAVAYKGLGRYDQAKNLYQEILKKSPNNADATWNLAILNHRHLRDFDNAIALYNRFEDMGDSKSKQHKRVGKMIAEAKREKSDLAAQKAREEKERKRIAAIQAFCKNVGAGKRGNAAAVGGEQERVEAAWQLVVDAQSAVQAGNVAQADATVNCAFEMAPNTARGKAEACAPMGVMWTQILYQLGRLDDALTTIRRALKCDANNPDAQLIEQQLLELMKQQGGQAQSSAANSG